MFLFKNNTDNNLENINYYDQIENSDIRCLLMNFFEKSVISKIPSEEVLNLINCINADIKNNIVPSSTKDFKYTHILDDAFLNSNTHKSFLSIIKNYFGNDAYAILKERKNLCIYNLENIHVLHQEVFDNLGKNFVNNVLNYDLQSASIVIPKILSNKEEMYTFKYFHEFYVKNIGSNPEHYNNIFLKYEKYKNLLKEVKNIPLSKDQKTTLREIFRDENNTYSIHTLKELNSYYEIKNNKYEIDKQNAISNNDLPELKNAILKNFFGLSFSKKPANFKIDSLDITDILKCYDLDDILYKKQKINGINFSDDELEIIKDLKEIYDADLEKTLTIAKKYENKGNRISSSTLQLIDKIPLSFTTSIINSLSKISTLEAKCLNHKEGITKSKVDEFPVYTLDGIDFSFLTTTNFLGSGGISHNKIEGDLAESWFTYENGTSHISCSYINQDKLCSIEFCRNYSDDRWGQKVSYLFDTANILAMGSDDIYSTSDVKVANLSSARLVTKFMNPDKLIQKSNEFDYNEIAINRYNPNSNTIRFAGKIIPSAILVDSKICDRHIEVANSFTKFLIKNGLKSENYRMPIVVIDKKAYQRKQSLILSNKLGTNKEQSSNTELVKKNNNQIPKSIKK